MNIQLKGVRLCSWSKMAFCNFSLASLMLVFSRQMVRVTTDKTKRARKARQKIDWGLQQALQAAVKFNLAHYIANNFAMVYSILTKLRAF